MKPLELVPADILRGRSPAMRKNVISILIPLYNEEDYIGTLLERVLAAPLPDGIERELCVVDDCSTDGSYAIAASYADLYPGLLRVIRHPENRGKGAAIRSALALADGEYCVFQDADLEYDPREIARLLKPMLDGNADVVFGSRFAYSGERRVLYFWHSIANRFLTLLCNMASDLNLTDMETCYKAFRTSLLKSIPIRSERFGIEPELTIKVAKRNARVYETPISYHGRTYAEGKKIGLKDAFDALWKIIRFASSNDIYCETTQGAIHALSSAPRFNHWLADTVRPYIGERVLELGAGIGNLSSLLVHGRKRWISTDTDEEHVAQLERRFRGRRNVNVLRCDLACPEDFEGLSGSADSVLCFNMLEHVEDDSVALRNIFSAVAPGGRAIVLVPQDPKVFGSLDRALGHHRRYSQTELKAKMEAAGFRVDRILEFNRATRPAWYLSGRLFQMRDLQPIQLKIFDSMVWLMRKTDRHLPWPANSIIAIGEKEPAGNVQVVQGLDVA